MYMRTYTWDTITICIDVHMHRNRESLEGIMADQPLSGNKKSQRSSFEP